MKLSIAYINDVHGYLEPHPEIFFEGSKRVVKTAGGYSRILSEIIRIRKDNPDTLVFDGGDTFHGTLPLVESKEEAILLVLNTSQGVPPHSGTKRQDLKVKTVDAIAEFLQKTVCIMQLKCLYSR